MSFIILDKFPQGSDEWLQARKGRATASQGTLLLLQLMLENLEPAPKITAQPNFRPAIEFDGLEGEATTPGYATQPARAIPHGVDVVAVVAGALRTSGRSAAPRRPAP